MDHHRLSLSWLIVKARLIATPSAILPLALTTCNLGTAWVVASATILTGDPSKSARLLDVCGSAALVLILTMPFKFILQRGGWKAFCTDVSTGNPPYAAGIMAMWGLAGWWHARGACGFAAVLWTGLLLPVSYTHLTLPTKA